jgi:hypothetical protein
MAATNHLSNRYATHLGSPSHQDLPPPLVAQSALFEETAPPLKGLCNGCQPPPPPPLDTKGSLSCKITLNGWTKQVGCPKRAKQNESTRQHRQACEKAALAAALIHAAKQLAATAVGAWPEHAASGAARRATAQSPAGAPLELAQA